MNKSIPAIMIVTGVGLLVYAFSDYVPGGAGDARDGRTVALVVR